MDPELRARLDALEAQNDIFLNQIGNRQTQLKNAILAVSSQVSASQTPTPTSVRDLFRATGEMVVSQVLRHEGTVYAVNFSADGKRVVTASSDGAARIWDAQSGRSVMRLSGHEGPVHQAAFRADGKFLATAGADNARL